MRPFTFIDARTPEQAAAELGAARPELGTALLKAGGVDVLDRLKEGLEEPARLVSLRGAPVLGEVREEGEGVRVGALVTLARLAEDPLVRRVAPALSEAAAGAATPPIREVATLGGNLLQWPRCWYLRSRLHPCRLKGGALCYAQEGENDLHAIFDNQPCAAVHPSSLATALLVHEVRAALVGPGGPVEVPLGRILRTPAELVRGGADVLCSLLVRPAPSVYLKVRQKQSFDWPLAEVAVALLRDQGGAVREARVALGAVGPLPRRAEAAERALRGLARAEGPALRRAAAAALEGARPLGQNAYKVPLLEGLLVRALGRAFSDGGSDAR